MVSYKVAGIAIAIIAIVAIGSLVYYYSQPKRPQIDVKTLIFAFNSDPSLLDPAVVFDDSTIQMGPIYETLTWVTPEGEVKPRLAVSWESSEDGLTWTFNLRKGVLFHDGTEFNATAVKYTFERVLGINKGGAYMLYCIDKMEVLDTYVIRFTLKYPVRFDLIVGGLYTTYIVSPSYVKAHASSNDPWAEEWMKDHACGTGPYKLAEWIHGQQVVLEKFDKYWGGWSGKHVDRVVIKTIRETTTAELMLKTGEIDGVLLFLAAPEKIKDFENNPDFRVYANRSYHTIYLRINTKKPPCDNVKVRQALSYAFPYDDVVNIAYLGYAEPLQGPLPKGMWGHDDKLFMYSYNLEKAKQLLAEAGYPNGGFTIDLYYYSGSEPLRKTVELYKSSLAKLGIVLNARAFPFDELYPLCVSLDTAPHISAHDWWPSWAADPYDYLYGMFHSEAIGIFNWAFYENKEVDRLIEEANKISMINRDKSIELYKQVQRILVEEAVTIYVVQRKALSICRSWVHGFSYNPNYEAYYSYYDMYKEV